MSLLGGAVAAWPAPARAQPRAMPTVGVLLVFSREAGQTFTDPIRAYLQALGHAEGRNIVFDFRPLYGDTTLCDALRAWLLGYTQANPAFLRLMVQNALDVDPPTGRAIQLERIQRLVEIT